MSFALAFVAGVGKRAALAWLLMAYGLSTAPLAGQTLWRYQSGAQLGLDLQKPLFAGSSLFSGNFALTASGEIPLGAATALSLALPIARAGATSSTYVGNPWIGLEVARPEIGFAVGVRPGIAKADDEHDFSALLIGIVSDFDHIEAWGSRTASVRGLVRLGHPRERGAFVTGIVGGTWLLPSSSNSSGTKELALDYGVRASYAGATYLLGAAITGRYVATYQGASLAERTTHQLAVGIEGLGQRVRPIFEFRYYLDPEVDIDGVVQVGLKIRP